MVVHAYYPLAEPRVQREARAARDAGCEVTVLALRGHGEAPEEDVDGIHVKRVSLGHERGAGFARMLFEYLMFCALACWWLARESMRRPFDIVHFHNPPDFLIVAGVVPRLRGSKLILDVHDLSSHMITVRAGGPLGRLAAGAFLWIERLACASADAVVTVHGPYSRELARHGVPALKVRVVMNSVDEAVLERSRQAASLQGRSAAFRVAYHGTLTWWYGTDLIVEAVARLRQEGLDLDAVVLGDGDALHALRARAHEAGLEPYVHFSERYVPIERALATVSQADCGVIPNRPSEINRFALSSKLFEYVALGVPVVVAELETLAAHFGPEEVTFFEPGSPSSLASAIRWVYRYPQEARAKAGEAQARLDQYSWARNREVLAGLYERLLAGNSATGRLAVPRG